MFLHELFKDRFNQRNIDIDKVKIVRHTRKTIMELIEKNKFEYFNCLYKEDHFKCDYVIVFIGIESTKALFWNIYKVNGKMLAKDNPCIDKYKEEFPNDFKYNENSIYYDLITEDGFDDMHKRLVIDWGNSTRKWIQKYNSRARKIFEIKRSGYSKEFPGYLELILSFKELEEIVNNPDDNYLWKDKLSSVFGIYLLVDKKTELQYIGAAYNEDGIWGRWENHINTGFKGSKLIKQLLDEGKIDKYDFQFTILEVLPNNSNKNQVLEREKLYKQKLRTREKFNLN